MNEDLQELIPIFEDFLTDYFIEVELEWTQQDETTILLSSFEGQFDYLEISEDDDGDAASIDFFFESDTLKTRLISIPVHSEEVEVNLEETAIEITSGDFFLRLSRIED